MLNYLIVNSKNDTPILKAARIYQPVQVNHMAGGLSLYRLTVTLSNVQYKLQRRILRVSFRHCQLPLKEKSRSPAPLSCRHPTHSS